MERICFNNREETSTWGVAGGAFIKASMPAINRLLVRQTPKIIKIRARAIPPGVIRVKLLSTKRGIAAKRDLEERTTSKKKFILYDKRSKSEKVADGRKQHNYSNTAIQKKLFKNDGSIAIDQNTLV
jgi:hypothetical protein